VRCSAKHLNPVLCVERSDGGGIVPVEGRIILRSECTNLLGYLWIDRVFLLGKGGKAKLIANPTRATGRNIFIISSGGLVSLSPRDPFAGFLALDVGRNDVVVFISTRV
jgi:hypothetical protein